MLKKYIITLLAVCFLSLPGPTGAAADETSPVCARLDAKAGADILKYSLDADVNGPIFFADIRCGVRYRKELCAMEMVNYDRTAKVYDYYSAEKIDIGKAYFWLDENRRDAPILAFRSKETAEKYGSEKEGGVILDYTGLTDWLLK
jgi:hypothetical protein